MLTGCGWFADDPEPPPPDPLERLLAATRTLAVRYDQVRSTHPDLADRLAPLHEAHLAHETALREMIGAPATSPSPQPTSGGTAGSPPPADPVPDDAADALAQLRAAEQSAQEEAADACLSAPPDRVALLGSITAARASHPAVLA